jgi:hypothetical protein
MSWASPAVGSLVIVAKLLCLDGIDCFDRPCQRIGRDLDVVLVAVAVAGAGSQVVA